MLYKFTQQDKMEAFFAAGMTILTRSLTKLAHGSFHTTGTQGSVASGAMQRRSHLPRRS